MDNHSWFARHKNYFLILGLSIIFFMFGTMMIIPIFNKREDVTVDTLIDNNDVDIFLRENVTEQEAFYYFKAPANTMGVKEAKFLNWSYWKKWLNNVFDWRLQASNNNNTWQDANELLTVVCDFNETNNTAKISLILNTTNAPKDLYYRFDLVCNRTLKDFIDKTSWFEYELTLPANDTENYSVFFNWSDIKDLISSGKVWVDKGITEDFFWFRIQSCDKVAKDIEFIIDPVFGHSDTAQAAIAGTENAIRCSLFKTPETYLKPYAITFRQDSSSSIPHNHPTLCGIYDINEDLVEQSKETTITYVNAESWETLDMSGDITLEPNTYYWLVTWTDNEPATGIGCGIASHSPDNVYKDSETYDSSLPDNFNPISSIAYELLIYCSFNPTVPYPYFGFLGDNTTEYEISTEDFIRAYSFTMNATDGLAQNITANIYQEDSCEFVCGIYDNSNHLLGQTENKTISADGFYVFNFSSPISLSASTTYKLAIWSEDLAGVDHCGIIANYNAAYPAYRYDQQTYNGTLPYEFNDDAGTSGYKLNIWCGYTEAEVEETWQIVSEDIGNGVWTNTTQWHLISEDIGNGIWTNSTIWHLISEDIGNGQWTNITQWNLVSEDIGNGIWTNTSAALTWQIITEDIGNGIWSNTTQWHLISEDIGNGVWSNSTIWNLISENIGNGIWYNTTQWQLISEDIGNGIWANTSAALTWQIITEDIGNGIWTNSTSWNLISEDIGNGIWSNSTTWNLLSEDIGNGVWSNSTTWNLISEDIGNGQWTNITQWTLILEDIGNGVWTNTTQWHLLSEDVGNGIWTQNDFIGKWKVVFNSTYEFLGVAPPLVYDINHDGYPYIFYTGQNSTLNIVKIFCINGSNGNPVWNKTVYGTVNPSAHMAIDDLNNDSTYEIVVSAGTNTVAYNCEDGSIFWNVSTASAWNALVIADIDDNNLPYVYISSNTAVEPGQAYIRKLYGNNGTVAKSAEITYCCYGGISIADLDCNGEFEVFVTDAYEDHCYDEDLNLLWETGNYTSESHCAILDNITGDRNLEIVVMNQSGAGATDGIYVYYANGSIVTGKDDGNMGLQCHAQPCVYDIDLDGNKEIITAYGSLPKIWDLVDWSLDATLDENQSPPPFVGDVMGDSNKEIIATDAYSDNNVDFYNSTFNNIGETPDGYYGLCVIADIDNDGDVELVGQQLNYAWVVDCPATMPSLTPRTDTSWYSERRTKVAEYIPKIGGKCILTNPIPSDTQINVPLSTSQLNITINEPNGDKIDWYIETSPDIGNSYGTNENNGTKICSIAGLSYGTTYTWFINATDGTNWKCQNYTFTTESETWQIITEDIGNGQWSNTTQWHLLTEDIGNGVWSNSTTWNLISENIGNGVWSNTTQWQLISEDIGNGVWTNTTANSPPVISNPYPSNGSYEIPLYQIVNVTITDINNDKVNVTWYSNATDNVTISTIGLIGSNEESYPIFRMPFQRLLHYVNNTYWIFWGNNSDTDASTFILYSSSSDGVNWNSPVFIRNGWLGTGAAFSTAVYNDEIHYIYSYQISASGDTPKYRKGTFCSNGTIVWSAPEDEIATSYEDASDPNICVNSTGYPWVSWFNNTIGLDPIISKSTTKDGSFTNDTGYPMDAGGYLNDLPDILPLTNGNVYCVMAYSQSTSFGNIRGRLFNESGWQSIETVLPSGEYISGAYFGKYCALTVDDEVHIVYLNTNNSVMHVWRNNAGIWQTPNVIKDNVNLLTSPIISKDENGDLYCVYAYRNSIFYKKYDNLTNTWDLSQHILLNNESTFQTNCYDDINCFYEMKNHVLGIGYRVNISNNYYVKFLRFNTTAWSIFGVNNSVSSGTNISQYNANFSQDNTTYYWKVVADDGEGNNVTEIYHFTTGNFTSPELGIPSIDNELVGYGTNVTIGIHAWDNNTGIDSIKCNVTYPDNSFYNFSMVNIYNNYYELEVNLTDTWQLGRHNYSIWASDGINVNETSLYSFNVSAQCNVTVKTDKDNYVSNEYVNLTGVSGGTDSFGNDGVGGTGYLFYGGGLDYEYIRGSNYTTNATGGYADNITVKFATLGQTMNYSCAIYEYIDNVNYVGSIVANGITETKEIPDTFDNQYITFNFSNPKPYVNGSSMYYLLIKPVGDYSGGGNNQLAGYPTTPKNYGIYKQGVNGLSWDSPLTGEAGSSLKYNLICSYSIGTEEAGNESIIDNVGTTNNSAYLLIQIEYNNSGTWIVEEDTINETNTRLINSSDTLRLDNIFNGIVNTDFNLSHGNGMYRIYVAFRDKYGGVLINDDDSFMNDSYIFNYTKTIPTWQIVSEDIGNGVWANTSAALTWQIITEDIGNGVWTNTTQWHLINEDIGNGIWSNSTTWNLISEDIGNGQWTNITQWNLVSEDIGNGIWTNTTAPITWQLISEDIGNGQWLSPTTWQLVDEYIFGQSGTVINGSSGRFPDEISGTIAYSPAHDGYAEYIYLNINDTSWDNGEKIKAALYDNTTGDTFVAETVERSDGGGKGDVYYQFNFSTPVKIYDAHDYYICSFSDSAIDFYWVDTPGQANIYSVYDFDETYPTFPNIVDTDTDSIDMLHYCKYNLYIGNGTWTNTTSWHLISEDIGNGYWYNGSVWYLVSEDIGNGIWTNTTAPITWQLISEDIGNGIWSNSTKWTLISEDIGNGIWSNTTQWQLISEDIGNGYWYNSTPWRLISEDIGNGIWTNSTTWHLISEDIGNGIWTNGTSWHLISENIGNGIWINTTTWWRLISEDIGNGQWTNTTVWWINISNPYPDNNSFNAPLQPIIYATINSSVGYTMNISWFYGLTLGNETMYLGSDYNISNSTQNELLFAASSRATNYYWRVMANDGIHYINETFNFKTEGYGGAVSSNRNIIGIVGIMGVIGIIALFLKRRKKKREY